MRFLLTLLFSASLASASIWVEGEAAVKSSSNQHGWYHGQVKKGLLSGGEFLAHFGEKPAEANYKFQAEKAGGQTLWVRANPVGSSLSYALNGGEWVGADLKKEMRDQINIAGDDKPDIRFLAWSNLGAVPLKEGENTIAFRFDSKNNNHGSLDAFVFSDENFQPSGALKPEEVEARKKELMAGDAEWFPWDPGKDKFAKTPLDLRHLNEKFAGELGGIGVKGAEFVYRKTGQPVRFWAVNGPGSDLDKEDLAYAARLLAKRGVNLVRLHGGVFDGKTGEIDRKKIAHLHEVVAAMKKEGIYSHLSIYFPLWLTPENGPGWREGYDGKTKPFATLYFEPEFQKLYRSWWKALLTEPGPDGVVLAKEPAVMGAELVNEDSFFFWTFSEKNIPAPKWERLEKLFATWSAKKYGSVGAALNAWGPKGGDKGDSADQLALRDLYRIFTFRTLRDQDNAEFLYHLQRDFYDETTAFLKNDLGFQGLVTASNWHTANAQVFGPLEKFSYSGGDFIDRHGYFGNLHEGENSSFSIREGHVVADRSALKFEPKKTGGPMSFDHPATDTEINGKPSMISETTWTRPNRYRGEAPLFYAAYASLQGTDAIVHFAMNNTRWTPKPRFFVQPWTLLAPTQIGQFPAAALIYRRNYLKEGELLADFNLSEKDAFGLKGNPLGREASLDKLRETGDKSGAGESSVTPLIHFAGRTALKMAEPSGGKVLPLEEFIDPARKTVLASSGELFLDYGKGYLLINSPMAQGILGDLAAAGPQTLPDLKISSEMAPAQIIATSLDGQPLAESASILVQVMTEEKPAGYQTEKLPDGTQKITSLGKDPWMVKKFSGTLSFTRSDAATLSVTPLDPNGAPLESHGTADSLTLLPDVVYYLISKG